MNCYRFWEVCCLGINWWHQQPLLQKYKQQPEWGLPTYGSRCLYTAKKKKNWGDSSSHWKVIDQNIEKLHSKSADYELAWVITFRGNHPVHTVTHSPKSRYAQLLLDEEAEVFNGFHTGKDICELEVVLPGEHEVEEAISLRKSQQLPNTSWNVFKCYW